MASHTETVTRTPDWSTWRGGIAMVVAVVSTVGLFWWIGGFQPFTNGWTVVGPGFVTLEVPYRLYNEAWVLIRGLLGAYITVVFLIVFLQLVGTWRRLIAENGGEA